MALLLISNEEINFENNTFSDFLSIGKKKMKFNIKVKFLSRSNVWINFKQ